MARKLCSVDYVLSMFSDKKDKAIQSYIEFMDIDDKDIKDKKEFEFLPDFDEIEAELYSMSYEKKEFDEIVEDFESKYGSVVDTLKGKYLRGKRLELRREFIKYVLQYRGLNQRELGEFLGISCNKVSRIYNGKAS